jgi:hypothetical protein
LIVRGQFLEFPKYFYVKTLGRQVPGSHSLLSVSDNISLYISYDVSGFLSHAIFPAKNHSSQTLLPYEVFPIVCG